MTEILRISPRLPVLALSLLLAGCGGAFPDQAVSHPPEPLHDAARPSPADLFARLDRKGAGKLDRSEVAGHWAEIFQIFDSQGRGTISAAEFMALPSPRMTERATLMEMEDPARFGAFNRIDKDGDGFLSLSEFLAARDQLFDILDRDGDGFLTPAELGIIVREEPGNLGILRLPPLAPKVLPPSVVPPPPPVLGGGPRSAPGLPGRGEPSQRLPEQPPPPPPPPPRPPG